MKKIFSLMVVLTALAGCNNSSKVDQKAEAEHLMDLSRQWAASASNGDLENTLNYWAEDALILFPDQPAMSGHEQIRKILEHNATIPGFEVSWEPKQAYVSESGDLGYVYAHNYFSMLDSMGNRLTFYNKGIEVWKKQEDGSWKNVVDIFNSDPTLSSIK